MCIDISLLSIRGTRLAIGAYRLTSVNIFQKLFKLINCTVTINHNFDRAANNNTSSTVAELEHSADNTRTVFFRFKRIRRVAIDRNLRRGRKNSTYTINSAVDAKQIEFFLLFSVKTTLVTECTPHCLYAYVYNFTTNLGLGKCV